MFNLACLIQRFIGLLLKLSIYYIREMEEGAMLRK